MKRLAYWLGYWTLPVVIALLAFRACGQIVVWPSGTTDVAQMVDPGHSVIAPPWGCDLPQFCNQYASYGFPFEVRHSVNVPGYSPTNGYTYVFGMISGSLVPSFAGPFVGVEPFVEWMIPESLPWPPANPSNLVPMWSCAGPDCWTQIDLTIDGLHLFEALPLGCVFFFQLLWFVPDGTGMFCATLAPPVVVAT